MYGVVVVVVVAVVVVRRWIIESKQLLFQRNKRKKTLVRIVRMPLEIHLEIGIPMINCAGKAKSHHITLRTRIIYTILL